MELASPPLTLEDRVRRRALKARMFGIEEPPVRVGRYELSHTLGEGAMGVVYAARDVRLDRRVAIKLLRPEVQQESARLEREARALARLSDPNVVTVHEVGEHEERTFLVMELVEGRSLRAWLAEAHPLVERLAVLRQAAQGLAAAHRLGLVHRDFKPENAIVGADGRLRIVDFGLALGPGETGEASEVTPPTASAASRITSHGRLMGTPAYMAPELLAGAAPGPRSDQFALCCVAWEVLFGAHPRFARGEAAPAVRVDRRLQQALRQGLSPRPEQRHADVGALVEAFSPRRPVPRMTVIVGSAVTIMAVGIAYAATREPHGGEGASAEARRGDVARADDALPGGPGEGRIGGVAAGAAAPGEAVHPAAPAPGVCPRDPAFDRPRRDLEHSRQQLLASVEREGEAGRASAPALLEGLAEVELALGLRAQACPRLLDMSEGAGQTQAACWHQAFCVGDALPFRALCFGGDGEACMKVAIKHEFELLAARADARAGVHDQAEVLASAHLGFLLEVLEQGCALGDADACAQRDTYLPAVAPREPAAR